MRLIEKRTRASWILRANALYDERRFEIRWDQFFPDGAGSKHQRSYFLKSTHQFVDALIRMLEQQYGQIDAPTIMNWVLRLRTLVRWMVDRNLWRFSQLDAGSLSAFIEARSHSDSAKGDATKKVIEGYVRLLQAMWNLRHEYIAPLRTDPFCAVELPQIVRRGKPLKTWGPVPIEDAVPAIKEAIRWIRDVGPIVTSVAQSVTQNMPSAVGKTRRQFKRARNLFYASLDQPEFAQLREASGLQVEDNARVVQVAMGTSVGAAITTIAFLGGMRVSEIRSLRKGCLCTRVHSDGHEYRYIQGVAAKQHGRGRLWVVPKPVEDAIAMLESIRMSTIGQSNPYLFVCHQGNGAFPMPWTKVRRLSDQIANRYLRDFFRQRIGHVQSPELGSIHMHRARKTFARFVSLRNKRGLEALAQHFGHLYTAITDRSYVGNDLALHELINDESQADLAEGLTDLIVSRSVGGKAGAAIKAFREQIATEARFRGKRAIAKVVEDLIARGVALAPCDWGYCLYAEDMSSCHGNAFGPDPVNRSPSTCSGCSNFAVTEKHRSWWEERYRREEEFLHRDDLPQQTRSVSVKRLGESRELLRSLNAKERAINGVAGEETDETN